MKGLFTRILTPFICFLLFSLPLNAGETGRLTVVAVNLSDGSPLPGVTVLIEQSPYAGVTDGQGQIRWLNLQPGRYTVRCELSGFSPVRVTSVVIVPDSETRITCPMSLKAEEAITVTGQPVVDPSNPANYHFVSRAEYKDAISPDIFSQAKLIPGVIQNGEVLDYVFIRGTPQRATALSIDGSDARNAVHLTTGIPVFAKGALEGIEIITGSLAPEYGNVLGGVLNSIISTGEGLGKFYGDVLFTSSETAFFDSPSRERNQFIGQAEIGFNPSNRFGFKVAFARFGGDAMPWTYEINDDFIDIYDLWLIGRFQPNPHHRFKVAYERVRANLRFHSGPTQEGLVVPPNFWQTRPHENDFMTINWTGQLGKHTVLSWTGSYLRTYDGAGPTFDGRQNFLTLDDVINNAITTGSQRQIWTWWPIITFYESRRWQSKFSLAYHGLSSHELKATVDFQFLDVPNGFYANAFPAWTMALICSGIFCPIPPGFSLEDFVLHVRYEGNGAQVGASVQDLWTISPSLRVLYGARVDHYGYLDEKTLVSPRLSLIWQPTPKTVIKLGGGRFVQPAPPAAAFLTEQNLFTTLSLLFQPLIGSSNIWVRQYITNLDECRQNFLLCRFDRTPIKAEKAWSVDFEWDQQLTRELAFRVSAYYKRLDDMLFNGRGFAQIEGQDIENRFPEALVNGGEGRAYGIEFSLRKILGPLTGWLSYTYAVAEGTFPSADYRGGGLLDGQFRPLNFDVRHQIQLLLDWRSDWLGGIAINTSFRWNTGYPTTERFWRLITCEFQLDTLPPAGATPLGPDGCIYAPVFDPTTGFQKTGLFNAERMPDFLLWDFKVEKNLYRFKESGSVRLVAVVENVLNRKNYGTWTTEQNSYREIDVDTGAVITEGARLKDRRFQLGLRVTW